VPLRRGVSTDKEKTRTCQRLAGILSHNFFESALKLATERDPLLLDTSILYALCPQTPRDVAIRKRIIDLLRKSDKLYVPDLALLEAREVALSRGKSHLEAIRLTQELFKCANEAIFPLGVGAIKVVAVEPDDLAYEPHVGFYDATILAMGARRGFYVVTAERDLRYFSFARDVGAKAVNYCLWHLAKYYYRIAERYVGGRDPASIVKWINERGHRVRKWEERYGECIKTEVEM